MNSNSDKLQKTFDDRGGFKFNRNNKRTRFPPAEAAAPALTAQGLAPAPDTQIAFKSSRLDLIFQEFGSVQSKD